MLDKQQISLGAETAEEFWRTFQQGVQAIRLKLSDGTRDDVKSTLLQQVKSDVSNLNEYSVNSRLALPPYDIRRNQEILDELTKEVKEFETKLQPAKKFSFSKRAAPTTEHPKPITVQTVQVVDTNTKAVNLPPGSYVISNKKEETIHILSAPHNEDSLVHGIQVYIQKNENCSMHLPWVAGSIRLEDLVNCQVILGPCQTSVYLENVVNSTLWICCHQLRIHNCSNCKLYVRANSHPIIEDCINLGFAPYSLHYENIQVDLETTKLKEANCWDNVVDFRWHKQTHSPNWYVIDESSRTPPPNISTII